MRACTSIKKSTMYVSNHALGYHCLVCHSALWGALLFLLSASLVLSASPGRKISQYGWQWFRISPPPNGFAPMNLLCGPAFAPPLPPLSGSCVHADGPVWSDAAAPSPQPAGVSPVPRQLAALRAHLRQQPRPERLRCARMRAAGRLRARRGGCCEPASRGGRRR